MADIARLQAQLAENLDWQGAALTRVHATMVAAASDIDAGNAHIARAARDGSDLMRGVVFFLLMCTVSLWFLHWHGGGLR